MDSTTCYQNITPHRITQHSTTDRRYHNPRYHPSQPAPAATNKDTATPILPASPTPSSSPAGQLSQASRRWPLVEPSFQQPSNSLILSYAVVPSQPLPITLHRPCHHYRCERRTDSASEPSHRHSLNVLTRPVTLAPATLQPYSTHPSTVLLCASPSPLIVRDGR